MTTKMKKYHDISDVTVANGQMSLTVDGKPYTLLLADHSPRLAEADSVVQEKFEISPSGYGIRWAELDEDLSVDGLIGVQHAPIKKNS